MIKKYIEYLKDNPEGYWFKRKLYGWGWTPAKWQGWVVLLVSVAVIVWVGVSFGHATKNGGLTDQTLFWYFAKIIICLVALLTICYKKGEKPRWQWGIPKE